MKKKNKSDIADLRSEYNFYSLKNAVRGKYVSRYRSGTNLIHLAPDVAKAFPNEDSVNETLRSLIKLAKIQTARAH
ncbi:MAG: hypothetical protein ACKVQC_02575 [Elusimicrobiota bacterium]